MSTVPTPELGNAHDDTAIHHMPGHHVRRLQQVAAGLFARFLQPCDVTPIQYAVLATLEQHAPISQAALSLLVAYDRATIGGVIDRLDARGLLQRTLDPGDRRLRLLDLTSAGIEAVRAMHPLVLDVQARFLAPLTRNERHRFEALCLKLLKYHAG